jgi:LuxR family maltose regulon positive regulatory protein
MATNLPQHAFVLPTKLHRPPLMDWVVPRRELVDLLAAGAERRLTLISGPAGFGKSTLVVLWLEEDSRPAAWLSLDELDNDLTIFVTYLISAVRETSPDFGRQTEAFLVSGVVAKPNRLADFMLADLAALSGPLHLVIDDYHVISALDIHAFLGRVIEHLPAGVRLTLISRFDPPLPLARLRVRRQMTEIRGVQLQFRTPEAAQLLQTTVGSALAPENVALLEERTEGWPAALYLAALSLRDHPDPVRFFDEFGRNSHQVVMDYLLSEVLMELSPEQRRFLLYTSILDRFCAPLCAAVMDQDASRGAGAPGATSPAFQITVQANLFLIALDNIASWFRYHHLFRHFLEHRLHQTESPETIAALHLRASRWFEEEGLFGEAIEHAVKAGEDLRAVQLIERACYQALAQDDWMAMERWLTLTPTGASKRPAILVARAFVAHYHFRTPAVYALTGEAESALEQDSGGYSPEQLSILFGLIAALRSNPANAALTVEELFANASHALELLPAELEGPRSHAELYCFMAQNRLGGAMAVAEEIEHLHQARAGMPVDVRSCRLLLALGDAYYHLADLPAMERTARALIHAGEEAGRPLFEGWGRFGLGWVHYQRNDLTAAMEQFNMVSAQRDLCHSRTVLDSLSGLALALSAAGRQDEAATVVENLRAYIEEHDLVQMRVFADALAIQIWPEQAVHAHLGAFMQNVESQVVVGLVVLPVLAALRGYLAAGDTDSLDRAAAVLRTCGAIADRSGTVRRQVEIGALTARFHWMQENSTAALDSLRECVLLAATGGALRLVADVGPVLDPLLHALQDEGVAPAYVAELRSILSATHGQSSDLPVQVGKPVPIHLSSPPEIDLTNREMEVLLLLADRLTNKEIAQRLTVSPRTVQKHTISLYQKLDAKNRRHAVLRAREIGVLA